LKNLRNGNLKPTRGDIRCIAYGHLARLAVWNLRKNWNVGISTPEKLKAAAQAIEKLGGWPGVEQQLTDALSYVPKYQNWIAHENQANYGGKAGEILF
jgi:hypothetical protein